MNNEIQKIRQKSHEMMDVNWIRIVSQAMLIMLLLLLLSPLQASAGKGRAERERFVLDFGDSHFRGNPTLFLKRELLNQYPRINIADYRLRRVVLVAKTKVGHGSAQLRVGPEVSPHYRVDGAPRDFHSYHPRSFDRVRIRNPFHDSWGPWQLFLKGNFKVRKIVLVVEKRYREHYGRSHGKFPHERFYFGMRW